MNLFKWFGNTRLDLLIKMQNTALEEWGF
jgi:hypothetical protein